VSDRTIPLRLIRTHHHIPRDSPIAAEILKTKPSEIAVFLNSEDALNSIGMMAKIERILNDENERNIVLQLTGIKRARTLVPNNQNPMYAYLEMLEDQMDHKKSVHLIGLLLHVVEDVKVHLPLEIREKLERVVSLAKQDFYELTDLVDVLCGVLNSHLTIEQQMRIIGESNVSMRASQAAICFLQVKKVAELRNRIDGVLESCQKGSDVNMIELCRLRKELVDILGMEYEDSSDPVKHKAAIYERRLFELESISFETLKTILSDLATFKKTPMSSADYSVRESHLDLVTTLPWGKLSVDNFDMDHAKKVLEDSHYGMENVKERILEFIAVAALTKNMQGKVLCFAGPPGVGKTSICEAVAKSINRQFQRFAVGGVSDSADLKGHRRTYVGAMPGRIIQAVERSGTSNPVILIDEIDKISSGSACAALLDVLDPSQNQSFTDSYLEVPFDLSRVLFLATANYLENIPGPLKDRLEIINIDEYLFDEKLMICKKHIIPKAMKASGLTETQVELTEEALHKLVSAYSYEPGVRNLQRNVEKVFRKIALRVKRGDNGDINEEFEKVVITSENLKGFLGHENLENEILFRKHQIPGCVIGMYASKWMGGCTNSEAIAVKDGKGQLHLTGNCGASKKETAKISWLFAQSYLKNKQMDHLSAFFKDNSVHLHFPDGATPKDGPSGGIMTVTALLSLAMNKSVRPGVAMTGEMSMTGKVLPVGGIRSKCLGALRNGIETVILPKANEKDWLEVPEPIRNQIKAHFVQEYDEVFNIMFGL
jgi:Lon-like ATP-dependent protease